VWGVTGTTEAMEYMEYEEVARKQANNKIVTCNININPEVIPS
jgi:hypothetical protein